MNSKDAFAENSFIYNRKFNILDSVRIPFQYAPACVCQIVILDVMLAFVPVCNTYAVSGFINNALSFLNGSTGMGAATGYIAAIVALLMFRHMAGIGKSLSHTRLIHRLKETFQMDVRMHRARLLYRYFEDAETCDLIERVGNDADERIDKSFRNVMNIASLCVSVAGVMVTLTVQIWWAGIAILALAVPLMLLAVRSGKADYKMTQEMTGRQRRYNYLKEMLLGRSYVCERDLFQYTEPIAAEYRKEYEEVRQKDCRAKRGWFIKLKIGGLATSLLSYSMMLILLFPVIRGTLSIGMYLALVGTVLELVSFLSWQITAYMDAMAKDMVFYSELSQMMELETAEGDMLNDRKEKAVFGRIEFCNVHFTYPGQDHEILRGLSLTIENGKSYSFVGINGAGKTTVIKLLTGLYKDYTGEILVDGRELRTLSQEYLRGLFGCIYQDYCRYEIIFSENITLDTDADLSDDKFLSCLKNAGLEELSGRLADGVRTNLGKLEENGVGLSGGEWQKVALARALYQNAAVLILDEPTASMDPRAEFEVYQTFKRTFKAHTVIMISHRLGSTLMADHIFVLSDGKIAEQGSHQKLMKLQGIYADMYNRQRRWYQDEIS